MEKCPKCGKYFLSYSLIDREKVCLNESCNYREPCSREEYIAKNDLFPKLVRSIELRGFL